MGLGWQDPKLEVERQRPVRGGEIKQGIALCWKGSMIWGLWI